jgi:chemotaxis protein CheX
MSSAAKKSFLVCDDEPQIVETLTNVIQRTFPQSLIVPARDGVDALQKINRQHFDLLVLDLKMPKCDGPKLIESIKNMSERARPGKVLIFTGAVGPEYPPLEGIPVLHKPCTQETLAQTIQSLLAPPAPANAPAQRVNVQFINPLIEAVLQVMRTTTQTEIQKKGMSVRVDGHLSGDISALVSVVTQEHQGSLAISFTQKCFLHVVSNMLGESYNEITPEISDAAGEICNQVFGVAKRLLNEKGHQIQPAIPTIVTGKNHRIQHTARAPIIVLEFECTSGIFYVELCIASSK